MIRLGQLLLALLRRRPKPSVESEQKGFFLFGIVLVLGLLVLAVTGFRVMQALQ